MKKLTKLLSVFIIAGAVGTGVAGATACSSHTHNFGYTDKEDGQHHSVQCDGCDEEFPDELHVDGDNNGKCDLCDGAVSGSSSTEDAVTGVAITGLKKVAVKGTLQLTATVTVTGNAAKTVTWSSSDEAKATVDATGKVTGVAEGQVTITATSTHDTTKKADYVIEVVAEGTVIEKSTYEKLLEKDNVRAKIDVAATAGNKLTTDSTADIYMKGSADNYENDVWVEYADEGGTKVLKQVSKTPDQKGAFNVYTIINPGPVKGEVEGVFTTMVSHIGTNGDMIVFNGNSSVKIAMAGSDKDGGTLTVTYNNGTAQSVPVTGVKLAVNTYIEVYFKLNLTEGKVTIAINGVTALDGVETGTTVFDYVQISSSDSARRVQTTKDIVICGTPKTLQDSKDEAKALIDAELAKYDKATDYTTNAGELDAAVAKAKKAVDDAEDIAGVNQAVAECKADLKAVLKDADIEAARTKALADLQTAYPEERFTFENLADDNAKYNNKQLYKDKIAEVTTALATKNTAAEMKEITDAAATYLDGKTNSKMLELKVAEAKTALTAYAAEYKETLTGANAEAQKTAVDDAVVTQSGLLGSANQITEVDTKLEEAKTAIQTAAANVGKPYGDVQTESKAQIDKYCTDNIGSVNGDTTYVGLINAAVTKYKGDIDALTDDTPANRTAVDAAIVSAKAAIDCYIDNYTKQQEANAYRDAESAKVKNTEVKAAILALDFTDTFKDITVVADRTTALANAKGQVDDLVASLATLRIAVSVGNGEICYVTYGTKLTLSDLRVSGFNVSAATLGGKAVPAEASDDEDLTVYNAVTVTVTGKTPINGFKATEEYTVKEDISQDTAITNSTVVDNNLFAINVPSDAVYSKPANGVSVGGYEATKALKVLVDGPTLEGGQVKEKGTSIDKPYEIVVKQSLATLDIYLKLSGSNGKDSRTGDIYYSTDGGLTYTAVGAVVKKLTLTNLTSGTIIKIYADNTSISSKGAASGASFFLSKVDATVDTSKIEKTVNVTWGTQAPQSYHYFTEITAPADPKTGNGEFIGWYNKSTGVKFEDGKIAEGNYEFEARYEYTVHITYNNGTKDVDLYLNISNEDAEKANLILAELDQLPAQGNQVHTGWELNGSVVDFAILVLGNNKADAPSYTLTPHYETSTTVLVTVITVTAAGDATEVKAGGSLQLTATPNADADNKEVTWSSSDEDTATVDATGKVTGVKQGSVTITATAKDGSGVTGTIDLTVTKPDNKTGSLTLAVINASTSISDPDSVITLSTTKTYKIKDFGSNKVSDGQGKEFANALIGNSDGAWDCKITSTKAATVKIYLSCAADSNTRNTYNGAIISANGSSHTYEDITTTGTTYDSKTKVNTLTPYSFTLYLEANETVTITSTAGRFAILAVEYDYVP